MTIDRDTALAALRPAERRRLERFSELFERIDADAYSMFAEQPPADIREVQERAIDLIGSRARREGVRAAVDAFLEAASFLYRRRQEVTNALLFSQQVADSAEDRVRFLASVDRAVVALVLWDELAPYDRITLLGPWSSLLDPVELERSA
jgi:hypothetical protein